VNGTIELAAEALTRGELVIMPTETVYGLAGAADDPKAVARIFEAKGRPRFNPLIAHVLDVAAAEREVTLSPQGRRLAEAFWPGPLTLVAPARDRGRVSDLARAGLDSVAVRAPAHPVARDLLAVFGRPVAAPSANRSGRPSPTRFDDAVEETGPAARIALDGGPCGLGLESTVVSLLGERPAILRPGSLPREAVLEVVGVLDEAPAEGRRSPGRLAAHYAPDAPVRMNAASAGPGEVLLAFGPDADEVGAVFNLSPSGDLREAAANLFAFLRQADRLRPTAIAVAPVPDSGLGEAINDRLRRASGFVG
jgi:L-threonylcarbamoyladenylate synthase